MDLESGVSRHWNSVATVVIGERTPTPQPLFQSLLLDGILFGDWDFPSSLGQQDRKFTCHVRITTQILALDPRVHSSLAGGFCMIGVGTLFAAGNLPKPVFRLFMLQVIVALIRKYCATLR
jgi:hypothetical protein